MLIGLLACSKIVTKSSYDDLERVVSEKIDDTEKEEGGVLYISVDGNVLDVVTEDNLTVDALLEYLSESDLEIEMEDYGGFEKVGPLGFALPTYDASITTDVGDIVLYQGDKLVLFYGSNTWRYTRIGRIQNNSQLELRKILGNGDISVKLSSKK